MEHTAQCGTYAYLRVQNGEALKVFETLSEEQPFVYRTWKPLRSLPAPGRALDNVQAVVKALFREVRDTLSPPQRSEIHDQNGYDK
jgi:hypothetical protein